MSEQRENVYFGRRGLVEAVMTNGVEKARRLERVVLDAVTRLGVGN